MEAVEESQKCCEGEDCMNFYVNLAMVILVTLLCMITFLNTHGYFQSTNQKLGAFYNRCILLLDKYHYIVLLLIFAVFLFSRLFRIAIVPSGIHLDELGIAYDAQCIAEYGVDRNLVSYPVYPANFADGCSALYMYLSALIFKIAGYSITSYRLPAVICAVPCFFCSYLLVREMFEKKSIALLAPILVTVLPWYFMSERWGLDCNLFLSIVTIVFYFYIKAIRTEKYRFYILAGIFFGLTLYTYVISYLILPVFLIVATIYLILVKRFKWKQTLMLAVPLGILASPLIVMQLVNMRVIPQFSFLWTDFVPLAWYRSGEMSLANVIDNLDLFKRLLVDPDLLRHSAFPGYGTMYFFSIPLVIYGLAICVKQTIVSIKNRKYQMKTIILIFAVVAYCMSLILYDVVIYRVNEIFMAFMLMVVIALENLSRHKRLFIVPILVCYLIAFLSFGNMYYRHQYEIYEETGLFIPTTIGDVFDYFDDTYNDGRKVYIQASYDNYVYNDILIALYGEMSPYEWSDPKTWEDHYCLSIPEEIDPDEDCLYILGSSWNHISAWMIEHAGYTGDTLFPGYTILYRAPAGERE